MDRRTVLRGVAAGAATAAGLPGGATALAAQEAQDGPHRTPWLGILQFTVEGGSGGAPIEVEATRLAPNGGVEQVTLAEEDRVPIYHEEYEFVGLASALEYDHETDTWSPRDAYGIWASHVSDAWVRKRLDWV